MERFENITENEINERGVVTLADRPNAPSQYGKGGMTAAELKAHFDAVSKYLAGRLNNIHDTLATSDAAEYIHIGEGKSLRNLIDDISSGALASTLLRVSTTLPYDDVTLQGWINLFELYISDTYATEDETNERLQKLLSDAEAYTDQQLNDKLGQLEPDTRYLIKPEASEEGYTLIPVIKGTGEQTTVRLAYAPKAYAIAGYSASGCLTTNEPTMDAACANKKYVDDLIQANKDYVDDMIAAILGGGDGGYTVTIELGDDHNRGLAISKTAPLNNDDYDLLLSGDLETGAATGELTNVNKLYVWVYYEGGTELSVSKNGDILITGNGGYSDNGSYNNVLDNVIEITEDCVLSVTIGY